jgi:hypothetical protein
MRKFPVRFITTKANTKGMDMLQIGDQIIITPRLTCTILEVFTYKGRKVYQTDRIGLVYADELEGR